MGEYPSRQLRPLVMTAIPEFEVKHPIITSLKSNKKSFIMEPKEFGSLIDKKINEKHKITNLLSANIIMP
jgi:hypothetical protein